MNNKTCGETRRLPGRLLVSLTLAVALCLQQGCSKDDSTDRAVNQVASSGSLTNKMVITGSSTMAPLVDAIGKRFQALHSDVKIEVQSGGSGRGVNDARAGLASIGMASRALKDEERDLLGFPIARDGICIIVNKNNPVQTLTDKQIIAIYAGKLTNWKEVGGRAAAVEVLYPRPEHSSYGLFMEYFKLNKTDLKSGPMVGENHERIKAVRDNWNAIVYVSIGDAERAAARGEPIKLLAVGNVAANSANVRKGIYPISRPLTLITKDLPTGRVKDFIEFTLSSQVTDLITEYNFVSYLD